VLKHAMTQGTISQCRSDRLTQCAVERVSLIRRSACGFHRGQRSMTALKGRTYDCTVRGIVTPRKPCQPGRSTYASEPRLEAI